MAVEQQASARRRQMLGLIIGLIIAGGSGLGLFYLVNQNSSKTGGTTGPTQQVVVASQPIPKGTKLAADNVEVTTVPLTNIPQPAQGQPQLVFNTTDVLTTSDHFAAIDIGQGEILTTGNTATTSAGSSGAAVAPLQLRDGDVAMAIPVTDQKGVGGWISAGDHIDVIADVTGNGSIRYTMQDVPILRIGSTSQQTAGAAVSLIVVEVNRREAEELAFLVNAKGLPGVSIVTYVLRPKDQWGVYPKDKSSTQPYQPNYLSVNATDAKGNLLPLCPPGTNPQTQSATGQTENVTCTPQAPADTAVNPTNWSTLFPG